MIREAEIKDIPQMVSVVIKNDNSIKSDAEEEIMEIFFEKNGSFFVYEEDNQIVGFMGYKFKKWGGDDVYWAIWLYVDPDFKRKGIGTKLYERIEDEVRKKGCRKIYLDVGNEEDHQEAIKFHLNNGFIQEAKLNDFWTDGEHCLLFSKRLA
ncbi:MULTISPECIES: GNAT family N-acetyltransferase [Cytobacillus]|uniref:GNAT family N-acetyltransferase n=1 Tax=Cytobacillus TaxID=2675230 RepID=UPI0018CE8CDC|nr:GNAT family N-acetyltransferase [Cytobacillus firmus]MBG9548459.1 GCN5 family acetyltransferase [Cytobacillus firmus]MBG9602134.1 GCN5 family acetyltransferase [Cytobacillus firmus]MED1943283.1 GNAT family N-acetyltransferase [Cytobacillus firmus]